MKVLVIDADSTRDQEHHLRPNLALMKLSSFHRSKGDQIELGYYDKVGRFVVKMTMPDKVYISCVFPRHLTRVMELLQVYPRALAGGSGYDIHGTFERDLMCGNEIEHTMPDYSLYGIDYSMGYTTRGCFRHCSFCWVPIKEGKLRSHAEIKEFLHEGHRKVRLLDNNFFAGPRWRDHIKFIQDHDLLVNFNQGIDVRIMTDEMADAITSVKYRSSNFQGNFIYIAFDDLKDEKEFRKGIEILLDHGIKPRAIQVYELVGFASTFEENMTRFKIIRSYDADPFVMKYIERSMIDDFFARWVNRKVFRRCSFDEYEPYLEWQRSVQARYLREDLSRWA